MGSFSGSASLTQRTRQPHMWSFTKALGGEVSLMGRASTKSQVEISTKVTSKMGSNMGRDSNTFKMETITLVNM